MAVGISVHAGLNQVDRTHYGWTERLHGCENDALAMADLARRAGFEVMPVLLGAEATTGAMMELIGAAVRRLTREDILVVTFSGHGSTSPDLNGDESDGYDEAWCLYDRQLLDDELFWIWSYAPRGARILVVADSCHSGTVTRSLVERVYDGAAEPPRNVCDPAEPPPCPKTKGFTGDAATGVFEQNRAVYAAVQEQTRGGKRLPVHASVLLLGACQDWQVAVDQPDHGVFTSALLDVWQNGAFRGNYLEFHAAIHDCIHFVQRPSYERAGEPQPAFDMQRPFTI
jgi:metacaspase-1